MIDRYGNELGFNYTRFLEDADPAEYAIPKLMPPASMQTACLSFKNNAADTENEEYVIQLLTKAKRQAIVKSIPVIDFLQDFDRHREGEILEVDFRRGVDNANIKMTPKEMDTICKM